MRRLVLLATLVAACAAAPLADADGDPSLTTASCAAVRSPVPPRAIGIFASVAYSFETSCPLQKKPKPFGMTISRRCL